MFSFYRTFCFLLFFAFNTKADVFVDLYESEIWVPDRTESTFNRAVEAGLSKVIVKLSGDKAILEWPKIIQLIDSARSLVVGYGYSNKKSNEKLILKVKFDQDEVIREMVAAGAPIWTATRSPVMALVVFQDRFGRDLLNSEMNRELKVELEKAFSERGVSLRYPLLDLTDYTEISADTIWHKRAESFSHIVDRYGIEDILVGRLSQLSSRKWIGEWIYRDSEKMISRFVDITDSRKMFATGADLVAKTMATRFSVKSLPNDGGRNATLRVVGIENFADYMGLVSWLEGLEVIDHANLERIIDNVLEFRLISVASKNDLSKIIGLNSNLILLSSKNNFDRLTYKWR